MSSPGPIRRPSRPPMHEASATEAILAIVEEKAAACGARRVVTVRLTVGELTGYVGDSIQFYFDRFSKGTVAEGATVESTYVKPRYRCAACGELFQRERYSFSCPACGGDARPTAIGREFYIDSMEVEKE